MSKKLYSKRLLSFLFVLFSILPVVLFAVKGHAALPDNNYRIPDSYTFRNNRQVFITMKYETNKWLGSKTGSVSYVNYKNGMYSTYANGTIYLSDSASVAFILKGAINSKYWQLQKSGIDLGYPTSDELTSSDGVGKYNRFEKGAIYWTPSTGAHFIWNGIKAKWDSTGSQGSYLGYPTTDEIASGDGIGCYQHFQGGSIYWSPSTGTHIVINGIKAKWDSIGSERSHLGYPTTDETITPNRKGYFNHFQGGSIYWSPAGGAHIVQGGIRAKWAELGYENSPLGFPTTDETRTPDGRGYYNHFEGGSIYWTPTTGAHVIWNAIKAKWVSLGAEQSFLGYPTTDELVTADKQVCYSNFEKGAIYWSSATGAYAVPSTFANMSIEKSYLGLPTSDIYQNGANSAYYKQNFQGGTVLYTKESTGYVVQDISLYFKNILTQYSGYDRDRDGTREINSLNWMNFDTYAAGNVSFKQYMMAQDTMYLQKGKKLVLVLVESRLLKGNTLYELEKKLRRYKDDLLREGYQSIFISADVYNGARHQDGRILLAIRDFFKTVKSMYPEFQGSVLVGSFPDAFLVRTYLDLTNTGSAGGTLNGTKYINTDVLSRTSFYNIGRADIVLSDLDGNWQDLYREKRETIPQVMIVPNPGGKIQWPPANPSIPIADSQIVNDFSFEDFFLIDDANASFTLNAAGTAATSFTVNSTKARGAEVSANDKLNAFPLAIPDIFVSRINAKNIAVNPDPNFRDKYGRGFLDANGRPQTVETDTPININNFWVYDFALEMKILFDYFDRNHNFRTGQYSSIPYRHGVVEFELPGNANHGRDILSKMVDPRDYLNVPPFLWNPSVDALNASVLDYVKWLKQPIAYRGIYGHSDPTGTNLGGNYTAADLQREVGPQLWLWLPKPGTNIYEPTLNGIGVRADQHLYRSIWENKTLSGTGANIFIHGGCDVNRPLSSDVAPYSSTAPKYGHWQNAENVLFFLNGVALNARGITAADSPDGFGEAARNGNCLGEGWKKYFTSIAQNGANDTSGAHDKRPYAWSLLGDWTLKSRY